MTIIDFVRLILKHIVLLILVPLFLGTMVLVLTINPSFEYSSETLLYTGLATGSTIEMDKTFNYQATNSAFDNLINIINSRETQEEVAIRLLAQHLMLPEANPKFISQVHFDEFEKKIPKYLYKYVATGNSNSQSSAEKDDFYYEPFPKEINRNNYEKTVANLTALMKSSSDNYVYELLNYDEDLHYSLKAIAEIKAVRINSSDLIKLNYTVNDPGICQQTLAIYSQVCIFNYKKIKENRSDAVVKYFESELKKAKENLKNPEEKLLEFSKSSNIINYYEQSKAVAVVKEDMLVNYKKIKAELAGVNAGTKKIEEKLRIQEIIQLKSASVLDKKRALGDLNFKIAIAQAELEASNKESDFDKMAVLKSQSAKLIEDIKKGVNELYSYQNSIEGLPISKILPDWINNVVESENLKAQIEVIDGQNNDFQEVYAAYAPAGATIKRLEREISVAEQGYLEILHGLNLAKLKLQDSEMSANLKTIDSPYFPLSPNPTKKNILIIAAAFLGGILTLGIIFVMEYFDDTIKNSKRGSKKTGFTSLGMMPKIMLNPGSINLPFVQERMIETITQNILQFIAKQPPTQKPKTIIVLSTQKLEGKTVIGGNIAKLLKKDGKKVVFLNYNDHQEPKIYKQKFPILNKILGYSDPRIDYNNPFLADVSTYLDASENHFYEMDINFYNAKTYTDILESNAIELNFTPDFVILEFPPLLYYNYPADLVINGDLALLVCRSNRVWSDADETAIANLRETCAAKINLIVNGVEVSESESIIGDLPKNRNNFRKKLKSMLKFQFFSQNKI